MAIILDESGASLLDESGALIYDEAGAPAGGQGGTGKQSGLGDDLFVGGYHIGGDIRDVAVNGGPVLLDVTHVTQSARTRAGGLRDGHMALTCYQTRLPASPTPPSRRCRGRTPS